MEEARTSTTLERLLRAYGVAREELEPDALALVADPEDEAALARVVRMAATNREMRRAGLAPLLLNEDADPAPAEPLEAPEVKYDEEERAALAEAAIAPERYDAVLRGTFGTVLGLHLNDRAWRVARAACASKRALACKDDEAQARAYLYGRLRALSERKVRSTTTEPLLLSLDAPKKKKRKRKKKQPNDDDDDDDDAPAASKNDDGACDDDGVPSAAARKRPTAKSAALAALALLRHNKPAAAAASPS